MSEPIVVTVQEAHEHVGAFVIVRDLNSGWIVQGKLLAADHHYQPEFDAYITRFVIDRGEQTVEALTWQKDTDTLNTFEVTSAAQEAS